MGTLIWTQEPKRYSWDEDPWYTATGSLYEYRITTGRSGCSEVVGIYQRPIVSKFEEKTVDFFAEERHHHFYGGQRDRLLEKAKWFAQRWEDSRHASPMFDWRRSPEYDAPGISADHHSAPLENGDRLHVYRLNADATNPWVFEIEPHDMPPRLPLVWHNGVNDDMAQRGMLKPVPMAIARNPAVDPPGTDRDRRNFSGWGRWVDDPTGETGRKWENGSFYTSPREAMRAAERRYLEEAPGWGDRAPHARGDLGFDYDGFFGAPGHPDDGDGYDIFGEQS